MGAPTLLPPIRVPAVKVPGAQLNPNVNLSVVPGVQVRDIVVIPAMSVAVQPQLPEAPPPTPPKTLPPPPRNNQNVAVHVVLRLIVNGLRWVSSQFVRAESAHHPPARLIMKIRSTAPAKPLPENAVTGVAIGPTVSNRFAVTAFLPVVGLFLLRSVVPGQTRLTVFPISPKTATLMQFALVSRHICI